MEGSEQSNPQPNKPVFPRFPLQEVLPAFDSKIINIGLKLLVDPQTSQILLANNNVSYMLGCDFTVCDTMEELIHPEDLTDFLLGLSLADQSEEGLSLEVRLNSAARGMCWVEVTMDRLDLSSEGWNSNVVLLRLRDITETRLLEQVSGPALVVNKDNLRMLLNPPARALFVPDALSDLTLNLPELIQGLIAEIGTDNPSLIADLRAAIYQRLGGSVLKIANNFYDLSIGINPETNALGSMWINFCLTDVTDKFQLEQTLLQQYTMLTEMMERVPFVIVRNYAMGGAVTYANRGAANYYNVPLDALIGSTEKQWYRPAEFAAMVAEDKEVLHREVEVMESEREIIDPKGEVRIYKVTKIALSKDEVMVLYDEITQRRSVELQQIELRARRQQELQMRGVLHDIITPLSSVLLSLGVAERYVGQKALTAYFRPLREQLVSLGNLLMEMRKAIIPQHPHPEQIIPLFNKLSEIVDETFAEVDRTYLALNTGVERTLPVIRSSAENMGSMIEDLRDIIQHIGKKFELDFSYHTVNDLCTKVQDLVIMFSLRAEREFKTMLPLNVQLDADIGEMQLELDMPRVDRVLSNLIGNAIKYTPAGGTVEVSIKSGKQGVNIQITDSGIGIDVMDLDRIFSPFYRGRNVGEIEGTGVGLATVRAIVEAHGWGIDVFSAGPGKGAQFQVIIPLTLSVEA